MSQQYEIKLILLQDCIEININNESVDIIKLNVESVIRPRHIDLTNEIIKLIREKGK